VAENPSSKYFFDFVTTAMSIVLGLIFEKVGEGIVGLRLSWSPEKGFRAWVQEPSVVGTMIVLTSLLILVGVVVTLSYIHNDLRLPYLRFYFLFDLIFAALCLFTAVISIQKGALEPSVTTIDPKLLTFAMRMLTVTFIALTARGLLTIRNAPASLKAPYRLSILPFHLGGIVLTFWASISPAHIVLLTAAGLAGSLGYLVFQWALQIHFKLSLVYPSEIV
jgi:hypothetical protein